MSRRRKTSRKSIGVKSYQTSSVQRNQERYRRITEIPKAKTYFAHRGSPYLSRDTRQNIAYPSIKKRQQFVLGRYTDSVKDVRNCKVLLKEKKKNMKRYAAITGKAGGMSALKKWRRTLTLRRNTKRVC